MITERDRRIIDFIEEMNFATIKIIQTMFFNQCCYGYDIARKRLRKIFDNGNYLRRFDNIETNEIVYTPINSKLKRVSKHNMKVLEYICKIKNLGCEIVELKLEPVFGDIKPDAYMSFIFHDCKYFQLIEVQTRHDYVNLERYKRDDVIEEILNTTGNVAPTLIIIQDTNISYSKINDTIFTTHQMDTKIEQSDVVKSLMV